MITLISKTMPRVFYACWVIVYSSIVLADEPRDVRWQELKEAVIARQSELDALIEAGQHAGVVVDYAKVSREVIATYLLAAQNDYDHQDEVARIFQTFRYSAQTDTNAVAKLPFEELKDCLEVADYAIKELERQIRGEIHLPDSVDFSEGGQISIGSGYFSLDGRPVFPSSLVWPSNRPEFLDAFGNMGQGFYHLGDLNPNGGVRAGAIKRNVAGAERAMEQNMGPFTFFHGHSLPAWLKHSNPEVMYGGRHFTPYDIDSPLIRGKITELHEGMLPVFSEPIGKQQRMHLLANEPHFSIREWGWLAKNGLSDATMHQYASWLENKYQTIDRLNDVYGTNYRAFDEVTFYQDQSGKQSEPALLRQISSSLRGGPVWYDAIRFNMDRVNGWFRFLKESVQANDGVAAPVTIKVLGFSLSTSDRDGGMDMEYLTNLQDVLGADLRVLPQGAQFFGKHEEGMDADVDWRALYAYDWVHQSMFLDFSKSLCPEKAFYDSEWHGFSGVGWRNFDLKRDYVRSALWLAFMDGMGAIKPWLWGRTETEALTDKADHIGELSTQPIALDAYGRVMKELNAHADWLAPGVQQERSLMIYYCEEAAIQDATYTAGIVSLYQALKLMNIHVGFTTPMHIKTIDSGQQTVLLPPTQFIKDASIDQLHTFQESGGHLVLVGDSFHKNELGVPRLETGLFSDVDRVAAGETADYLETLKRFCESKESLVNVQITDSNARCAYGVLMKQIRREQYDDIAVILNNVSKDTRSIVMDPRNYTDLTTGLTTQNRFTMMPNEVRVLSFSPDDRD